MPYEYAMRSVEDLEFAWWRFGQSEHAFVLDYHIKYVVDAQSFLSDFNAYRDQYYILNLLRYTMPWCFGEKREFLLQSLDLDLGDAHRRLLGEGPAFR